MPEVRWSLSCRRAKRIERAGEGASATDRAWLAAHTARCPPCAERTTFTTLSLNFLRSGRVDPDPDPSFTELTVRRVVIDRRRRTLAYWTPAMLGAGVAAAALLTLLQILFTVPDAKPVQLRGEEAHMTTPAIPDYTDQTTLFR